MVNVWIEYTFIQLCFVYMYVKNMRKNGYEDKCTLTRTYVNQTGVTVTGCMTVVSFCYKGLYKYDKQS